MVPPSSSLWRSWIIIGSLVLICSVIAWRSGGGQRVAHALTNGAELFVRVLPNLILGFALAGFIHVLIPTDLISTWLGSESGWKGLFVGTLAGMLTPGGPFTHFPIMASFLAKGAGVGPVCAYISAWALISVSRIVVWEMPILGPKVALVRFLASVGFPPLIGWLAGWFYRTFRFSS